MAGPAFPDRFRILDEVPIGCCLVGPGGRVRFWNRTLAQWTGVPPEAFEGRTLFEAFPHLAEPRFKDRILAVLDSGAPALFSASLNPHVFPSPGPRARIPQTSVTRIPGEEPLALMAVVDVTDQFERGEKYRLARTEAIREAEDRRAGEARLRALLDALPDAVLRLDRAGRVLDSKPGTPGPLPGTAPAPGTPLEACGWPAAWIPSWRERLSRVLDGAPLQVAEYQWIQDDRLREVEARFIRCGADEAVVILRDVTEQRAVETLKREFLATVSHELRSPLNAMLGALRILRRDGLQVEEGEELLGIAEGNAERLLRLVNDILDLEKMESGTFAIRYGRQEALPLVRQVVADSRGLEERHAIRLEAAFEPSLDGVWLEVDPDRFHQVLTNLISNAAKFAPEGSSVDVRAWREPGAVLISVRDRGPGIPPAFQPSVFRKFAQAAGGPHTGTGLGLSLARALAEAMGGGVTFESRPGDTTFTARFPEAAP